MSFLTSLGYGKNHKERDEGAKHKRVRDLRDDLREGLPRIFGRLQAAQQAGNAYSRRLR